MKRMLSVFCLMAIWVLPMSAQTPTQMPVGKKFFIQSAINFGKNDGGYWDIPAKPATIQRGANIQVWTLDDGHDRIFTIIESPEKGYYELQVGSTANARVDIADGKRDDATNVQTWDRNGLEPQRFLFQHMGGGRFKIFYRNKKALCLAGRSSSNGSNVHLWGDHNGAWMEWYLIDVQTKKPFIPSTTPAQSVIVGSTTQSTQSTQSISTSHQSATGEFKLQPDEQMVYGKIGLFENGDVKYTFAVVRKPNSSKTLYLPEYDEAYSTIQMLSGRGMEKINSNPAEYDQFDYWVIFNGERIGPYDRIYDMYQTERNVDNWVSDDGKSIYFVGVKEAYYYAIIANKFAYTLRTVLLAPTYDLKSGRQTYATTFPSSNMLFIDGKEALRGWGRIEKLQYSHDGKDFLYVGGETDRFNNHVYVNQQVFAGPFYIVSGAGFLPNTNIPYAYGFNHETVNGVAMTNYGNVIIGKHKIPIPNSHGVSNFRTRGDWVSFSVTEHKNNFKTMEVTIYEYNYKTDELKTHGKYSADVIPVETENPLNYYTTCHANGDYILVKQGGEILQRIPASQVNNQSLLRFFVAKNGDFLLQSNDYRRGTYRVFFNGKPLEIAGNQIADISHIKFCPESSRINLSLEYKPNKFRFINGSNVINAEAKSEDERCGISTFAKHNDDIIWARWSSKHSKREYYKNNQPLFTLNHPRILDLIITPDGSRHAAIISSRTDFFWYIPVNNQMHEKVSLLVDGKIIGDSYGAPVWSEKKQKFLVLQQVGNAIRMVEL